MVLQHGADCEARSFACLWSVHCHADLRWRSRMLHQVGSGKVVKVTGIQGQGRTATILLRGSNKLVLEEAERSLHDALCVIRCLVQRRALIPGGAAPEMEVEHQLIQWAKTLQVLQHILNPPLRCHAS